MPEPSDTDWAYAAGFVDGDGCIAIVRAMSKRYARYYYGVNVVVANTDRPVLDRFRELWGGYVVPASKQPIGSRDSWAWRLSSGQCQQFLRGVQPYLRVKAAQCSNALAMIELLRPGRYLSRGRKLPDAIRLQQEERYWRQREMNHRGTSEFERKAMHSPRRVHRDRSGPAALRLSRTLIIVSIA